MRFLILVLLWCLLLVAAWPLALLVAFLLPFIWLLSLPFRFLGVCVDAAIALVRALLFLPARILGHRG
jgi:hypothetical protein